MKNKKVVLVTGCSSGVGRGICKQLPKDKYLVIASARNVDSLRNLKVDLEVELDVTKEQSIQNAIDKIMDKYSKIDILINNAGYSIRGAIEEVSIKDAKEIFDVNIFGVVRMIQAISPIMRKQQFGRIINIGSVSGRYTQAANGCYCASKHGVEAITEAANYELGKFGVQVAVVEPGPMETEFFKTVSKNSDSLMKNESSPYREIYDANIKTRDYQKKMSVEKSANKIVRIIEKKKLKLRYMIAVPYFSRVMLKILEIVK